MTRYYYVVVCERVCKIICSIYPGRRETESSQSKTEGVTVAPQDGEDEKVVQKNQLEADTGKQHATGRNTFSQRGILTTFVWYTGWPIWLIKTSS